MQRHGGGDETQVVAENDTVNEVPLRWKLTRLACGDVETRSEGK